MTRVVNCSAFPRPLLQLFWFGGDFVAAPVQPHSVAGGLHALCEELKSLSVVVCVCIEDVGIPLPHPSC